MSIAVFTPGKDFEIFLMIHSYLKKCYPKLNQKVSFHLVVPRYEKPVANLQKYQGFDMNCADPDKKILEIIKIGNSGPQDAYLEFPHNVLRNLARQTCRTDFTFVTDLDMIPVPGMHPRLKEFLRTDGKCPKCVFVPPVYEVRKEERCYPVDKFSLMQFVKAGKARRYHTQVSEKKAHFLL